VSPKRAGRQQPRTAGSLLANLAASPFINERPVQRFTVAAWVLGALLMGANLLLWVQYRHDSTALRARLVETRAAIDVKSAHVVRMDEELRGLRLPAQNAQVSFLNGRIAERTFPWSLLFERIATTLPDGVRLMGLTPVFGDAGGAGAKKERAQAPPGEELVSLKIRGAAKDDEALYQLIDAFFAAPAFLRPRLYQESSKGPEVTFTVDVDYRPRFVPPADSTSDRGAATEAAQREEPAKVDTGGLDSEADSGDTASSGGLGDGDGRLVVDDGKDQHEVSE
jgi:hypothetical protein